MYYTGSADDVSGEASAEEVAGEASAEEVAGEASAEVWTGNIKNKAGKKSEKFHTYCQYLGQLLY